jgi:arylsulfatase A-like enzyme
MENTMFVFLSDHGHAFGEHGYAGKVVTALYPELTDTVFMIKHPGGDGAGRRATFSSPPTTSPRPYSALWASSPRPRSRGRT